MGSNLIQLWFKSHSNGVQTTYNQPFQIQDSKGIPNMNSTQRVLFEYFSNAFQTNFKYNFKHILNLYEMPFRYLRKGLIVTIEWWERRFCVEGLCFGWNRLTLGLQWNFRYREGGVEYDLESVEIRPEKLEWMHLLLRCSSPNTVCASSRSV